MSAHPTHAASRHALVTGGAGFIGSHLVDALLARGERVTVIDDLSTGRLSNLSTAQQAGERLTLRVGRLSDVLREEPAMLDGVDAVYHLAATVGVRRVIADPIYAIHNNTQETACVLAAAAVRRVPILIASSSEVYGKSAALPMRETDDLVSGPTHSPRFAYGLSKAIDEHLALAHHRRDGLPAVIVRLFNIVGPRQVGDYGMVLPRFVEAAVAGEPLEVYGDGSQTRCFMDVRDAVTAMPALLANPACAGEVYNLGSDQVVTIAELAHRVLEQAHAISGESPGGPGGPGGDPGGRVRYVPYDRALGRGFDDLKHRQPELTRLRAAVGFSPRYDLTMTIRDLLEVFRASAGAGGSARA